MGTAITMSVKLSNDAAIAGNNGTPIRRFPIAAESPIAVESPILSPVKLPGPTDTAIALMSCRPIPAEPSSESIFGTRSSARDAPAPPWTPAKGLPSRMRERLPPAMADSIDRMVWLTLFIADAAPSVFSLRYRLTAAHRDLGRVTNRPYIPIAAGRIFFRTLLI